MAPLHLQHCLTPAQGLERLTRSAILDNLPQVPRWKLAPDELQLERTFRFKDYYQTIAFVNAVAWVAHQQDHHPELVVHYNRCQVRFTTHNVGGISINDFICAAWIDQLHDTLASAPPHSPHLTH
jgi:4a-hydroxytetrahydrobiopterin dehydratase